MRTLRSAKTINRTFQNDLINFKPDDFIIKPHHYKHAVISLRNRKAIVLGYTNGPKGNAFDKIYHWNPDAEMVLFIRTPVKITDHFRLHMPDQILGQSRFYKKNAYAAYYSFSGNEITQRNIDPLLKYVSQTQKDMTA